MQRARERGARLAGTFVLFALVGLGALATVLSVREEQRSVHAADERAADLAASRIRGALSSTVASLRGADGLAADGTIGNREFDAFAEDVTSDSLLQALALVEVVTDTDRRSFEARTRLVIQDTDGNGGFVPAVTRPRSLVVTRVFPLGDSNRSVLGLDLASDPVRLAAAADAERTGLPAMSGRISTATTARPGIAVVAAVHGPDGTTIGFLSSGLDISDVVERAGVDVSSVADFSLRMDRTPLIGGAGTGASQSFDVSGHHFTVTVRSHTGFQPLLPVVIGFGTIVLLVAVTAAARRERRQHAQIELGARRSRGINDLGQALATAADVPTVIHELLDRGRQIMDAGHMGLALRSIEDPRQLQLHYDRSVPQDITGRLRAASVDEPRPFSVCVRDVVEVVVEDGAALQERYPLTATDATALHIMSVMWVPLMFGGELCIGSIGFTWPAPMSRGQVEERRVAARAIAELTSRSLERTITSMAVQGAADNLGELARALTGAHDQRDVGLAVRRHAATVLGARRAELVLDVASESEPSASEIERVIEDRRGTPIARLVLAWPRPTLLGPAQSAVVDTMVEIVGQTLERIALTEQEHQVIVQLQRDLLPTPPVVPGLDVAVCYQPAMSVVGLGGDFYDVFAGEDDHLYVVIGDVTGHGSEAIATMAELKAIIEGQLRGGKDLAAVCDEADLVLARRGMYATAQIVDVDRRRRSMRMINAGHPLPVLRRADGHVELLDGGRRCLLGLAPPSPDATGPASWQFAAGDVLLLYTDGLIEQRRQSIDTGMQLLVDLLRDHPSDGTAAELVARAMAASHARDEHDKTDDDVALLVVRMLS